LICMLYFLYDDNNNPDAVNNFFAAVATDDCYSISDVLNFRIHLNGKPCDIRTFYDYEIELLLCRVQHTSSGYDDLPCWVFKRCSYELAGIVAALLNRSFQTGSVPLEWLTAVITPVPKKPSPASLADYRPISVTPILSRLAEKIIVQQWLRPAIPRDWLLDQFGFRPSGSTTSALAYFMHSATLMLEKNSYVRCLLLDFSKAFDVVRHSVLLTKLTALHLPPPILNWIVAFLTGRGQVCRAADGRYSALHSITRSIIQGSGIGPTLWIIMESDLHPLSVINVLFKYADDTNLLVPENTDIDLTTEFAHIIDWADINGMIINYEKTKELVLHRPHPGKWSLPQSLEGVEQVQTAKLLGVIFQSSFSFVSHVDNVLKVCSQRIFILKQLRDQGLPREHLHTIFQAIILNRIAYAIPAWGPFLSTELRHKIDAFLKRSFRYDFTSSLIKIQPLLDRAVCDLFTKMQSPES
jgi:hypothetical protein